MTKKRGSRAKEERIIALGLTKLVERRFRGEMIETYNMVSGKENIKRKLLPNGN